MMKQIFYTIAVVLIGIAVGTLVYFFYPQTGDEIKTMTIRVFFSNTYEDPESFFCDKVYFAEREIEKTQTPIYATLKELLKGPTETEIEAGFFTNISDNVKVESFSTENRIIMIDFDENLNQGVAGSCMVQAIRAQITETLKEFEEVDQVIISIDGRTEDILQP